MTKYSQRRIATTAQFKPRYHRIAQLLLLETDYQVGERFPELRKDGAIV